MDKPIDKNLLNMLNSGRGGVINLYELYYSENACPLRFSNDTQDFIYNRNTYYSQTVKHSDLAYNSDGTVRDVTLFVGNAERQIQYYIERYDLLRKRVNIIQVYFDMNNALLGDLRYSYVISGVRATSSQADFTLSMGFDLFKSPLPGRRIYARFCSHEFKGGSCCYSGADAICSKTFAECKRKGNIENFGGFPGVRSEKLYF